jgi:hypothetical protein
MSKRVYRYPFATRFFMFLGIVVAALFILAFIFYLVISSANLINGITNPPDRAFELFLLIFGFFIFLYVVNLYLDIEILDDGLLLNASGIRFRVKWSDIKKVRRGYGNIFKTYAIETKSLTPFHRVYGIMYLKNFSRCFIVWSILPDYERLVSVIKEKRLSRF